MEVPDDFLAWAATLTLEMRRRVKEAQAFIGADEFGMVDLSCTVGDGPEIVVYYDETVEHRKRRPVSVLVLDAGAPIRLERNNLDVWRLAKAACNEGDNAYVPTGALAQVYNGDPTQARLNSPLPPPPQTHHYQGHCCGILDGGIS